MIKMNERKFILDKEGIRQFSEAFLNKVNEMIDGRIVNTIDENSTDDQIPSADALDKILNGEGGE